jgi:hypothetical protein
MNLLSIQDALKNASDQQLVQLMRAPDSTTPSYLVVSELNRRKQMRMKQAEPPSRTVAEDLTSEENMQAPMGIRSLQTPEPGDEDYPTEEDAPGIEAMREGGIVRMAAGTPDGVQGMPSYGNYEGSLYEDTQWTPSQPPIQDLRNSLLRRGREFINTAPDRANAAIAYGYNALRSQPEIGLFTSPVETAAARRRAEYLRENSADFASGRLSGTAFRENPERFMELYPTPAAQPQAPAPANQPSAATTPAPTDTRPPVTQPQRRPAVQPTGGAPAAGPPASGVRALTPSAAPAAAPDAMPTLQQNMERNLGMFPGIPQELLDRIRDSRTNEGDRRREAQNMALLEAGLRIAGSNNPNFLGAIGEGATPAAQTYAQQLSQIRQDRRADLQTDLAVAQADLQRRYMAGQISASELQRQTQMLISRDDRAARLEAARISAGSAAANTRATLDREQLRADQAEVTASRAAVERSVREALGDMGRVATVTTALKRSLGRDPTRDEVVGAITNEAIERNREIGRAFTRLNTGNTPRANSEVIRP